MTNRRLMAAILLALAALGSAFLFYPLGQSLVGGPTTTSNASKFGPETGTQLEISNPRLVLPPKAGEAAAVYFDVTNHGQREAVIRTIAIEHARTIQWYDTAHPNITPVENFNVGVGQTLRFEPGGQYFIATQYDEDVVPGASVRFTLTMANSETVSATAKVEPAPQHRP